ncbi:MAG: phosphotransferase [Polyangiaceae bacterium]
MRHHFEELVSSLFPGGRITAVTPLGSSAPAGASVEKTAGYGAPVRISIAREDGGEVELVFRTANANDYGHDRRSDRAGAQLLAYDTFGAIPRHVRPIDVGAISKDGRLVSLHESGELYLVTTYAPGKLYADDLREVAKRAVTPADLTRTTTLARYLVGLHADRRVRPAGYRRAVRDLIGHGEGIFGVIDGYPDAVPGAPASRLQGIEKRTLEWRWKMRGREARFTRTHGDFHPFNIVFQDDGELALLDTSRGSEGEAADDVCCLAVNYVFFALSGAPSPKLAWERGLRPLWTTFWDTYLEESADRDLLAVAAPFLAWRLLVLASPVWYGGLSESDRDKLLGFAERALTAERFDPAWADALFT